MMAEGITIVLADDHHVVRQGLRALLQAEPDFSIVGEAADGREALALIERLKPKILIVDVMMPGLNGLEVTRQVHQLSVKTRVVVLSMYANEAYVTEALRNGAAAYVLKESRSLDLLRAVREVAAGRHYLSPPLSQRAVEHYIQRAKETSLDLYDTLTTREREVLQLVAEGHTNSEVAAKLFISPRTAETHRVHLMNKLRLRSQTDLIRYALKRGILPMEN
jgi:DNA-binding NarL/FixJ family response regulator